MARSNSKIPAVCKWLLDNSRETVRELKRENESMVRLGDSKRLSLKNVRLLVPEGILVYQCIKDVRNKGEFLFTTRGTGRSTNPAYLSIILPEKGGELNYMKNVGMLLNYPWYDSKQSSLAFDRMSPNSNLYLIDLTPGIGPHTLS